MGHEEERPVSRALRHLGLLDNGAGGGGGIRTHGEVALTTVFETAPIVHSGTPPRQEESRSLLLAIPELPEEGIQQLLGLVGQDAPRHLDLVAEPG